VSEAPALVWFRQDLRLADQAALAAAAAEGPVIACYVLDDDTPGDWRIGGAQRWWLHHSLTALATALKAHGVPLVLRRGVAADEVAKLARETGARQAHALHHYEPWWQAAEKALAKEIDLVLHDGVMLTPPDRIRTGSGGRYRIFTPFWRALKEQMPPPLPLPVPTMKGAKGAFRSDRLEEWELLPTRPDWAGGFAVWTPGEEGAKAALKAFLPEIAAYDEARNLPSITGSSRLSPHLHFGEISPATVWHRTAKQARAAAEPYLREIGWRDFATNVIDLIPGYGRRNGRDAFDRFPWRQADGDFRAWTKGRTGYPIVDAGMRELWATGWMHNRVRMIAASFLVKHLLIDWRRGERWFWDTLLDADYGNNSVNWQWIAGTGIDSNPFGRIMAPLVQSRKFDAAGYIRTWVPELRDAAEDELHEAHDPLIAHREGRERALAAAKGIG
jgi:deoxyribodipyrimidine photo-lyase